MSITNIIMALFNLVPKKYKEAALKALIVTNWLQSAIKSLQETGVLDKTNIDEAVLEWLDKIQANFGMIDMDYFDYLAKLKPESFKGELGQIGAIITEELHGNSNTSTAKTFFEIIFAKNRQA